MKAMLRWFAVADFRSRRANPVILIALLSLSCSGQSGTGPVENSDTHPPILETPSQLELLEPSTGVVLTLGPTQMEVGLIGVLGADKFEVTDLRCSTDLDSAVLQFRESSSATLDYREAVVECHALSGTNGERSFRVGLPFSWDEINAGQPACLGDRRLGVELERVCADDAPAQLNGFNALTFLTIQR